MGSEPTVVIHWATTNLLNDPELLKDRNGNPLSAGANGNGNGHVVTLGYFDLATNDSLENHFNGSWVPLTQVPGLGIQVLDMDFQMVCFPYYGFPKIQRSGGGFSF